MTRYRVVRFLIDALGAVAVVVVSWGMAVLVAVLVLKLLGRMR